MKSAWPNGLSLLILAFVPLLLWGGEQRACDEAQFKAVGLGSDGPALLRFFQQRTLTEAEQARIATQVRRLGNDLFREREHATKQLRAAGRAALPYLRAAVNGPDQEITLRAQLLLQELEGGKELELFQAAARLLADRRPHGAAEVVLRYLPAACDELLEDELFAALAVVATAGGKTDPAVVTAAKDASPLRRGAAAWVLGRSSRMEERALVQPLLADSDPRVRLRAAQALLVGKEKEAVAVLIALLDAAAPGISWRAHEVLLNMAGEHAPAVSLGTGSNAERRKCRDAWTSWWRDHDRKLDLSRVELPDHFRGRVVVACLEGYQNGKGRVWEFGANWKVIWQLDNIRGAADVRVLPGNRVLVAEYGGQGVSEYDLTGKVLWKHENSNTHGCQRLRNGNTFVATASELLELSPHGKPVFHYRYKDHKGFDYGIYCARKLPNGHYAYAGRDWDLVEVDGNGRTVRTFPAGLEWCSTFDVLPNGHYLVPQRSANRVVEFDRTGKVVWQCHVAVANTAARLPNGRTLVGTGEQSGPHTIVEVDRSGKVLFEQPVQGRVFRIVGR
jgi:hypothetical protein